MPIPFFHNRHTLAEIISRPRSKPTVEADMAMEPYSQTRIPPPVNPLQGRHYL